VFKRAVANLCWPEFFGVGQQWALTMAGRATRGAAERMFRPTDIASLAVFRIVFGGFMVWHVWSFVQKGFVDHFYVTPSFHAKFPGFEWVEPLPADVMRLLFVAMGVAAAGIGIGVFYRTSAILFFLGFTYFFFLEKTLYQNHFYLVLLISAVMVVLPAQRALSVAVAARPERGSNICPFWCLWLVRFLVGVPYFFGGVAKLNWDWLQAQPMLSWLPLQTSVPVLGHFAAEPWLAWAISYGGLVFDLCVVPLLLIRKTRPIAYAVAVLFHLSNAILFKIGIFPWFMILATTIFFEPGWPRRFIPIWLWPTGNRNGLQGAVYKRVVLAGLGLFVTWQVCMPFRHHLYPGNVSWTEEGHYFSWHMMLRRKIVGLRFYATVPEDGRTTVVQTEYFLIPRQSQRIGNDPDMILQFVQFLKEQFRQEGFANIEIRAVALASLNGRKPQLLFDKNLNLCHVERSFGHYGWVNELTEPLPEESWNVPLLQWPSVLGMTPPEVALR